MNPLTSRRRALAVRALPYVACAVPIALYQALYVNGFYPITEGWFSEYAHLIRAGEVPYRDFPLLLPPLYSLQLAAFQAFFGTGLFALHLLGIIVTCAIALTLLDLLRNFFDPWVSAFAAAVGEIHYQSGVAFIGYDFTQFLTLYLLIAGALLVRSMKTPPAAAHEPKAFWLWGAAGLFLGFAFLIKQSNAGVAAFVIITASVFPAIALYRPRPAMLRVAALVSGFLVPVVATLAWLAAVGAATPFFEDVFAGAAVAKGGTSVALFAWVGHYLSDPPGFVFLALQTLKKVLELLVAMMVIAAVLEGLVVVERRRWFNRAQLTAALSRIAGVARGSASGRAPLVSATALGTLCILIVAIARSTAHGGCTYCEGLEGWGLIVQQSQYSWSVDFYVIGFAIGLIILLRRRRPRPARFFMVAALGIGLTFGNGTSAGLSEISTFLGIAMLFGFLINTWLRYVFPSFLSVAIALSFCVFFLERKFETPYSWWLMATPSVRSTACADARGVLRGLCMPPEEYAAIVRIENAIRANSSPADPIYVYPHMPIFYLLTNRVPFDGAVVSWFDFTSNQFAFDISRRLRADPPSVIVVAEIPEVVLDAHEHAFGGGKPLGQRKILASISALQAAGLIRRVERVESLNDLTIDVYKKVIRVKRRNVHSEHYPRVLYPAPARSERAPLD